MLLFLFGINSLFLLDFLSQPVVPETTGIPLFIAWLIFANAVDGVLKSIATSVELKSKVFAGFSDDEVATIVCPFSVANSLILLPILPFPKIAIFIGQIYKLKDNEIPLAFSFEKYTGCMCNDKSSLTS